MAESLADELYSESLRVSFEQLNTASPPDKKQSYSNGTECNVDDMWDDDDDLWDSSNVELNNTSDLNREWQKRHDHFHTIGYREGIIAGKEASAQEGFNIGFKESALVGYKWGILRGVTSALACLPDGINEKLVGTQERGNKLRSLQEAVHSLSSTDAIDSDLLANYFSNLQLLLSESPKIDVSLEIDHQ